MRALLAIVLVAAGLSGCDREEQKVVMRSAPSSLTTLHRGNGSEPDSLDPHKGLPARASVAISSRGW